MALLYDRKTGGTSFMQAASIRSDAPRFTRKGIQQLEACIEREEDCPSGQGLLWIHNDKRGLTLSRWEAENGLMSELNSEARRGGRLFYKLRVQAKGRAHNGRKFTETCSTVVVNSHGGLLLMKHEVDEGEMLVLIHPESLEEQECRVVYMGEPCDKGQRVGVEFLTPAPHFWGLECDEPVSVNNSVGSSIH
jgi:hypothetical protein